MSLFAQNKSKMKYETMYSSIVSFNEINYSNFILAFRINEVWNYNF